MKTTGAHQLRTARRYKGQGGFTLLELIVTLTVLSILTIAASDTLPQFIQETRITSEVNRLVTAIALARSEAIRHGRRVVLCPSADGLTCGSSKDWVTGWILFASENRERELDEPLLRTGSSLEPGIDLTAGNYRKRIVFQPDGSSRGSNSSFYFCDKKARATPRVICLSSTGRPRLSHLRCDGSPVECP